MGWVRLLALYQYLLSGNAGYELLTEAERVRLYGYG